MNNFRKQLTAYVETLLSNKTSWVQKRDSVHDIHSLFVSLGAINCIEAPTDLPDHLELPAGRAIAPRQAGMCLLDLHRTMKFAEGLRDAIGDLLAQFPQKTINVVDAGCGPYALLPLLATTFYSPQQVQFTLLDIHQANLESTKTLISSLGLTAYFKDYILADATTYQWPHKKGLEIVISETMNRALQKEPQVAITLNLAKQLEPHGVLIPESVIVDLCNVHVAARSKILNGPLNILANHSMYKEELGTIISLDKFSSDAAFLQIPLCSLHIPADYDEEIHNLELHTLIKVYKKHRLQYKDSSISMPLNLERPGKRTVKANDILDFYYSISNTPGIEFSKNKCIKKNVSSEAT